MKKHHFYKELNLEEQNVILHKGTEEPFTGKYDKFNEHGIYRCKQCAEALYVSDNKFDGGCGWPSFDDAIPNAVLQIPDADGRRTEIICANCDGHLGHVFTGEKYTDKNTRHCVNSLSMNFESSYFPIKIESAIFASGCFWGVEYCFLKLEGIISTTVGYTGGHKKNPTYEDLNSGKSGHFEAIQIFYDANVINYETLTKYYFETHNTGQENGQGVDIGEQYMSVLFYKSEKQKKIAEQLIAVLREKNYKVITTLLAAETFYPAENYHQKYYKKNNILPTCTRYEKKF
ncbi:MAG: bifunctional methionine sulfoxide reductase B/A protein [Bacteroidales bacterium]|nr:bifunctional methionine sulfoxide reductase B/A protein [Bacteroidales bacterium]